MTSWLKEKKVVIAIIALVVIGILPLVFKGLQFGMDFKGGTVIQINLRPEGNQSYDIETVISVMQTRLDAYGLKDISVKPFGTDYVVIEIAETNPEVVNQIQSLLGQQGKFETLFQGRVVLTGSDVLLVFTDPQRGYGIIPSGDSYEWRVPFQISAQAAQRLAEEFNGKCSTPTAQTCPERIFMFIDRPSNAVILIPTSLANEESEIPETLTKEESPTASKISINELVKESGEELIIANDLTDEVLEKIKGKEVIIPPNTYDETKLEKYASKVIIREKTGNYWIASALNLENIVHLTPGVTSGSPVTTPVITGRAPTPEQARKEMERVVILLKSGKLPVAVSIGSVSTISPTLGPEFLRYSMIAGVMALFSVASFIMVRYRKLKITIPIVITMLMEITMILGTAALIGWQLDLPAVTGIIAAVGTGVDHQIIITDEVLRGEKEEVKTLTAKVKKACSIIMRSATTTIMALIPLFLIGLGALKGFALTTIIGILLGVFITRPAFAVIIKRIL